MNTKVRRKLEMAVRVREFTRAHAATEPGFAPALTALEDLVTRAEAIVARQHQGRVAARGARARRQELRHILHSQLVHYLVAVGSVAGKDQADLVAQFQLPPTNVTNTVFLTAVKSLLAAGEGQRELLAKAGMAPALLDDLGKMVADFETESEAALTARRDHIGARADLEVITTELMEQVKVLDGLTRYRFGQDPEVMAEWRAAKQLLGQSRNGGAAPAPQPTPQSSGVQQAA